MAVAPPTEIDMFATSDQRTRYEQYRHLRGLGAVVRLRDPDAYVVTRYDEVKAALADHGRFISGEGVGFNPDLNQTVRGTTLVSDPPEHDLLRIEVDRERCEGHGLCAARAQAIYGLDDEGYVTFRYEDRDVPADDEDAAIAGASACPVPVPARWLRCWCGRMSETHAISAMTTRSSRGLEGCLA